MTPGNPSVVLGEAGLDDPLVLKSTHRVQCNGCANAFRSLVLRKPSLDAIEAANDLRGKTTRVYLGIPREDKTHPGSLNDTTSEALRAARGVSGSVVRVLSRGAFQGPGTADRCAMLWRDHYHARRGERLDMGHCRGETICVGTVMSAGGRDERSSASLGLLAGHVGSQAMSAR